MEIRQIRDITIIDYDHKSYLGIACDSCGGIGYKEHDLVKASPQLTAYHTGKVVLAELMSMGFTPFILADGLAVEMNNTGRQLIEGFNEVLSKLSFNVHLTGSTEENIKTVQTSMGVTCIGFCSKDKLKFKKTKTGDICLLVGLPMVGNEVLQNPDKILDIDDFEKLYLCDYINEMLPIGSRGIECELNDLLKDNKLKFEYESSISIDLKKSGGPSTSCLVTLRMENLGIIKGIIKKPINVIGSFL
ncbi:MAG TPA: selenophosphate synthase [Sedimentibacter sp.]|nr:selenophosphate synthase [Sedimentibacter sp.]HNZ82926.1 selenophosphate synthase [Sedimentibacter sp.]HOH69901.1 selenophosphate synthase [Sedimentibacter sp.]